MINYKLTELISKFGGKLVGDDVEVTSLATTNLAKHGQLTFFTDKKYQNDLATCTASAVIISEQDALILDKLGSKMSKIVTNNPYLYFSKVNQLFNPQKKLPIGIKPSVILGKNTNLGPNASISEYVVIGDNVTIGANCQIYSHVVIGDGVIIGDNAIIYPRVTLYSGVKLGNFCIIHAGSVIGADGFGYAPDENKIWHKIPQVGGVEIGDNVEIGANTTIDSGALEPTIIKAGVKIDNLVQIAHNNQIGEHSAIAAQVGIAGGTKIGKYCRIGGAAGITGHVVIADNTVIGGASNVSKDITTPGLYASGIPVFEYKEWAKIMVYMRNWGNTNEKIKALENQVKELINNNREPN